MPIGEKIWYPDREVSGFSTLFLYVFYMFFFFFWLESEKG